MEIDLCLSKNHIIKYSKMINSINIMLSSGLLNVFRFAELADKGGMLIA